MDAIRPSAPQAQAPSGILESTAPIPVPIPTAPKRAYSTRFCPFLLSILFPFPAKLECYAKTGQGWDKNLDSLCSILESELKTLDATFRFHTGGSLMKYTKKERMNIGRQIYEDQINKYEAAGKYGISAQTAREYMRMYRNTNHLPPKTSKPRDYGLAKAKVIPEAAKLDEYQKMSKEDLISALIDARIREERLKLGYEVVEEDDSKKKLITYVKKTAK
jgi:transposase